jgi:radical SAM superfamily enzyme YgiQ (UPF0313 family)
MPNITNNPMFRPPAEAYSLILQVDQGCPSNSCTFCGMYRGVPYRRLSLEEIEQLITNEASHSSDTQRIFLADGDVMRRPFSELKAILTMLNEHFPQLNRVNLYANGSSIISKSEDELRELKSLKLQTLYMGLESGDEDILKRCHKGETAKDMVAAGLKAQACGLRMSVMILLGLGGADHTTEHMEHTADALNLMQPRLASALRVIPLEGTELYGDVINGRFQPVTESQAVQELRNIVDRLDLTGTVFRANHSSNVVPLEGRFPKDKQRVLAEMDALLASGDLDDTSPGSMPLWL